MEGEQRAADDGCNTCTCSDGQWVCTEEACGSGGTGNGGAGGGSTAGAGGSTGGAGGNVGGAGGSAGGTVEPLCDGSDALRAVASEGGGFVEPTYEFTNPYGFRFLFVLGTCRYFMSRSTLEGVLTGHLFYPDAVEDVLGWSGLAAWSSHEDMSCPDAGATIITNGSNRASCTCGCDDNAPPGMRAVFDGLSEQMDTLAMVSARIDGPMRLLLVGPPVGGLPLQAFPWPLSWDPGGVALTYEELISSTLEGTQVTDPAEFGALRMLRAEAHMAYDYDRPIRVRTTSGAEYDLYLRDELPADVASAAAAMLTP